LRKFIVFVFLLLSTACAKPAAETNQPGTASKQAAATNNQPRVTSTNVVKVTPEELTLAKGESAYAVVRLQIQHGYHINANPPSFPYLKATELELAPASGISVSFVTYPDPLTKTFSFADGPLKVYQGDTTVKAMLKAAPAAAAGQHNLSAKLRVQACDDQVCYAPGTIDLTIPVTVK
jgi:DsbC/DsbD-like thiol-disulfide interchange protein